MCRHLFLAWAALCVSASGVSAQTNSLDVIPADATAAIIIRNPRELSKKGDDFLQKAEINLGIRPTDALGMLGNLLGVTAGWDLDRPSGAVMLRPADAAGNVGFEDLQRSVYVVLAYNDLDKMAGNFGFKEG